MIRSFGSIHIFLMMAVFVLLSVIASHAQAPPDQVRALAWNSDGSLLAVAGIFEGLSGIQLRDDTGQVVRFLETAKMPLSVSWSPDNTLLASLNIDDIFLILDIGLGTAISSFEQINATDDLFARWSPDINSDLIATQDMGIVRLYNVQTGNILRSITGTGAIPSITTFIWNQDGTQLFTISADDVIRAWDVTTLGMLREVEIDGATDLALSPDGTRLAVSSWFDNMSILDADTFDVQLMLPGVPAPGSQLVAVRWNPNGLELAASGYDKITIWDLTTGEVINTIPLLGPIADIHPQAIDYSPSKALTYVESGNKVIIQPLADAGTDQTLADGDSSGSEQVTLDGSGSSDLDGTIVSYSWSENGIEIATGANPQVSLAVGIHIITLTVTDDDGATGIDEVVIISP